MKTTSLIILLFACITTYASISSSESWMSCDASSSKSCQMRFDNMVIYGTGIVKGEIY